MAATGMLTGNSLTVKVFEKKTWLQTMQASVVGHAFNRGSIYFPEKFLGKDTRGDTTTFPFAGKLTSVPVGEGGTLDGSAAQEALDLQSHSMTINESRYAVLNPNYGIEQQRTNVDFESTSRTLLSKRAVELLDTSFFNQAGGFNPTTFTINGTTYGNAADKLHVQGHNTPTEPTTNRIVRVGSGANDQSISSSNTMSLSVIDYAMELNQASDQPIEPFSDGTFDLFLSPYDITNLKHDTTGAIQWFNIELAKLQGGSDSTIEDMYKNNMRCVGKYANVMIYEAPRVSFGTRSDNSAVITTVRRNVLLGQNALSFASPYGGRITDTDVPFKYREQLKDHDKYKSISAELLYGMKKMSPSNKEDIGVIVIATYAASHT